MAEGATLPERIGRVKVSIRSGTVPQLDRHVAVVTVDEDETLYAAKKRHYILLVDCSTSMASSMVRVREDVLRMIGETDEEEFISIIVYSGHDTAERIAGPTQCTKIGRGLLVLAAQERIRIMNTTVFSEPLKKTLQTARLRSLPDIVHSAILFTDGCPVPTRWDNLEELERTRDAAEELKKAGIVVSVIGYGTYYDEEFVRMITTCSGNTGLWRHISEIGDFGEAVADIRNHTRRSTLTKAHIRINVPQKSDGEITRILRVVSDVVVYPHSPIPLTLLCEGKALFFVEVSAPLNQFDIAVYEQENYSDPTERVKASPLAEEDVKEYIGVLGAEAFLRGDHEEASRLLALTGNEYLADQARHAHTTREHREVGDQIRRSFRDKKFIGAGLKPTGPSHCVLNVLRILIEDPENVVYIPKGAYQRTTKLTIDPRIVESPLGRVLQVRRLTSNDKRFNFSLLCLVDVKVKPENGGAPLVDAQMWRNYTVIKDGNLHLEELQASLGADSFNMLQEAGVISADIVYQLGRTHAINLRGLRMVSNNWANPKTLSLVPLMQEKADLAAEQTALNSRLKKLQHERPEFEGNIYHPTKKVAEGPYEVYMAQCCEYRLTSYKPKSVDCSQMAVAEANSRVRAVRQRLAVVCYLIRSIIFAVEATGSTMIGWSPAKHTQRGELPKTEQLATFDGAKLKRVTWEEQVACS